MDFDNDNGNHIGMRVTAFSAMGARKYMEDTFSVAYQKSDNGKDLDYAFFGMFDGHGGDTASVFAKNHLMNFIVEEPGFWSENDEDVLQAIKKGFIECHLAMWKDLDKWPPTASGLPSTAGTTASCAFLRRGKLYIGHCGDSGIVLGRTNPKGGKWIAQTLTTEHKPESPEELARIESCGGKVQEKQGTHRVVWYRPKNQGPIRRNTRIEEIPFLAVARSLGDLWSYNYKTEKFVVSPEPDVEVITVDVNSFKCLIFASDGLWNVIDSTYSVESVYDTERHNDHNAKLGLNTWRNPSRVLVEAALEKWRSSYMRADNTSVVCVMLDPPNKKNMFKFCRTPTTEYETTVETQESARTIFDYSTSEAYNLDYMSSDIYSSNNLAHRAMLGNYIKESQEGKFYDQATHSQYQDAGYNSFETSYGYQVASTSSQSSFTPAIPRSLTYQTSSNESAFVKACCRNSYTLAGANEQIAYHSSYEQHRQMYEDMTLRPYPPLHYAYRPVPSTSLPLPSLHANVYDHQGYLQNSQNFQPMKRFNYLRPTPEELAALHNEEDDEDTDTMEFSDDESDEEASVSPKAESSTVETTPDDSIQIFEISSSSFSEADKRASADDAENSSEETEKPISNKENTESSSKRRKVLVTGRFYATRLKDRKMRSGHVATSSKTIGKEKLLRKAAQNIKKAVKSLLDQKESRAIVQSLPQEMAGTSKKIKSKENKSGDNSKRVLRSAPAKEPVVVLKRLNEKTAVTVARSLRSKQSNVIVKPTTRKRSAREDLLENVERGRERRIK